MPLKVPREHLYPEAHIHLGILEVESRRREWPQMAAQF